jgi:hypothetical protein
VTNVQRNGHPHGYPKVGSYISPPIIKLTKKENWFTDNSIRYFKNQVCDARHNFQIIFSPCSHAPAWEREKASLHE